MAANEEYDEAKEAYLGLCDELNDPDAPEWDPEMWDPEAVKLGAQYAKEHGFAWPPRKGDYDRWWDIEHNEGHES